MALGYLISPFIQVEDINGKPLVGGRIRVYRHGTQIPYITYKDWNGDRNPSEVRLDAKGSCILIAEDDILYDVYCEDANYVEQWSRLNVSVGGGAGSGSGVIITSTDGSVVITRVGDTVDLSVADAVPSAIVTQSEARNGNGPFIFTADPVNITGSDIALVGSRIACKKRWYHYVATVKIDWLGTPRNRVAELTVSGPDCYDRVAFDLSFPHSEWLILAADYEIQHNGDTISFGVSGMDLDGFDLEGMSAQITNVSVHTIVGRGQGTGGSDYEGGDGISISENDVISVDWSRVQRKLTAGQNITIDENNVISANGGGSSYTAGDGIKIENDVISTDISVIVGTSTDADLAFGQAFNNLYAVTTDGHQIRTDTMRFTLPDIQAGGGVEIANVPNTNKKEISVKVGPGLVINNNTLEVQIDSDVSDVVDTVNKLKKDLDTQITTNFDMPNISQVYDFADSTNWMTANGACMLYQAFTIPINHDIRTLSEDANEPTLFGIYAQQNFAHKIMLALYEYQYPQSDEESGSSTYVGDTGPVDVLLGVNEYPLKNRNPSISELRSDRVYYAALYLPSTAFVNGLFLAGAPNYGNASVPATPRLSCATENITWQGVELDMSDPTTTLNHYQVIQIPGQEPYYQYYIGPWVGGYNERWRSPRFYMQIRNGKYSTPVIPTVPFETLGDDVLPRGGILASNLPNFSASSANSGFRDVTPLTNATITAIEWFDSMATAQGWEAGNCVYNSDYSTNLSGVSNTVTDLGAQYTIDGKTAYAHRITFTTPITLNANTTYRFLCSSFNSSSNWIWSWADPTNVFDATNNGWYVDWGSNVSRYSHIAGQYLKLYDSNNQHYVI